MKNRDVLISGASIAGPALAFWLAEAGFRPTIVERAPAPLPGGQAVDLRGAGRTVVERMGLMDRVRAVTLAQEGLAFVDARGRVKARMAGDAFGGEGIVSEIEVLRGDLARVLYEATTATTEYRFDDTIIGLAEDADGMTVTFERSAPRRFDAVIGADGVHSAVRAIAFGSEARWVQPLDCYMAWFTAPASVDLGGWFLMHNAPGGRVVSARPGRLADEVKVAFSFRSPPLAYDRRDTAAQHDIVARRFADVGWQAPQLLSAMRLSSDFFMDSIGQVHLDRWSRGSVALVGDAAYSPSPITGLGTSLALVGAYVLAGEMAAAGGDYSLAFTRYEEIMRPYVTTGQQMPPGGVGGFAPRRAAAIRIRTASMRWMNRWPMRPIMAKQFAKAGDIDLPSYRRSTVI